jgi:hypothetical protein
MGQLLTEQYQVALSFASEQRDYAERIARRLQRYGVSVFYDEYERANLWGKHLSEELYSIYAKQSSFVLMLISKAYIEKKMV